VAQPEADREANRAVYDDLAPQLNDLFCYFIFVGCWKELTPPDVVTMKRKIDKTVYLAAPLFPPEFFVACNNFLGLCFATFQGWGVDARLRTLPKRRRAAASSSWDPSWDACFSKDPTDPPEIRNAYKNIMTIFAREIGLNPAHSQQTLGGYPSNIA
jgi:hypothetical protein